MTATLRCLDSTGRDIKVGPQDGSGQDPWSVHTHDPLSIPGVGCVGVDDSSTNWLGSSVVVARKSPLWPFFFFVQLANNGWI